MIEEVVKVLLERGIPSGSSRTDLKRRIRFGVRVKGRAMRAMDVRSRKVLDDVFESDGNTWISISSHSGEIGSILRGDFPIFAFGEPGRTDRE